MAEKNDVFVGNLTFNTTEEQLRSIFSFVGPVKSIRILADKETGKPKGFAFVEYFDTNTALSAIRHLDQTELNSRKIKVGFPTQSNLKDVARQHGLVPETHDTLGAALSIQGIVDGLKLHEAWDLLECMKNLVEDDKRGVKLRAVLEQHPQLITAMYEIQKRLGIVLPAHIQQQQARLASIQANLAQAPPANFVPPPPPLMPPMNPQQAKFQSQQQQPEDMYRRNNFYDQGDSPPEFYGQGVSMDMDISPPLNVPYQDAHNMYPGGDMYNDNRGYNDRYGDNYDEYDSYQGNRGRANNNSNSKNYRYY